MLETGPNFTFTWRATVPNKPGSWCEPRTAQAIGALSVLWLHWFRLLTLIRWLPCGPCFLYMRCGACGAASLQLFLEVRCPLATSKADESKALLLPNFEVLAILQGGMRHRDWMAQAWGPCTKMTCSSTVGEESRTVYCGGSDGGVYDGCLVWVCAHGCA